MHASRCASQSSRARRRRRVEQLARSGVVGDTLKTPSNDWWAMNISGPSVDQLSAKSLDGDDGVDSSIGVGTWCDGSVSEFRGICDGWRVSVNGCVDYRRLTSAGASGAALVDGIRDDGRSRRLGGVDTGNQKADKDGDMHET